jgi:hypothetical protein
MPGPGECVACHIARGNSRNLPEAIVIVSDRSEPVQDARPANLVLIEQSGTKLEIPQPSAVNGMIEAERAMHRRGGHLRQVKVVSRNKAIARWKASELGWRRVA